MTSTAQRGLIKIIKGTAVSVWAGLKGTGQKEAGGPIQLEYLNCVNYKVGDKRDMTRILSGLGGDT